MIQSASRPAPRERADLGDSKATTLCIFEHRATAPSRQVFWLARCANISIAMASAVAEANAWGVRQ